MATIRLTPSTYYLSNSSYLSVSNESNMYADTDSTTYATISNTRSSTTSYYIYLRGFNFDAIPSDATINSFTIKFKAYESGVSTSTSYRPYLCNGTTTITGSCSVVSTSVQTLTFTGVSASWETIKGYGSNFGIRINCRRASSGTTSYMYIYGAEIVVDYTPSVTYSVTTSCSGGTVSPSGTTIVQENGSLKITAYPNDGYDLSSFTVDGESVSPVEKYVNEMENGISLFHLDSNGTDELDNSTLSSTASYSSSDKKFGTGCVYLNGSSYLTITLPQDYSPITVECWFNVTADNASGSYPTLFSSSSSTNAGGTYMHIDDGSYSTSCVCRSNASGSSTNVGGYGSVITRNTWHHFAYCRDGSSHYFFIDGTLQYTVTQSSPNSMETIYFGGLRGSSGMVSGCYMTGYIDELAVSSTCKWTSSFTAPSSAYNPSSRLAHEYTIENINSDKNVIVTYIVSGSSVAYVKINGSWNSCRTVYKKVNGSWIEVTDLTTIDTTANYVVI